jgi:hypothetical protein
MALHSCARHFPVGLAFYAWDRGVKRGDIRALGAASYAAPLISTILLVIFGYAEPRWPLALATVLITLGGVVAAKEMFIRAKPKARRPIFPSQLEAGKLKSRRDRTSNQRPFAQSFGSLPVALRDYELRVLAVCEMSLPSVTDAGGV